MPAPKVVIAKKIVRVQSCSRGWTEFFRDGCQNDTVVTFFPDGTEISGWFLAAPWKHEIPSPPAASAT
jgi:hypothetical protein